MKKIVLLEKIHQSAIDELINSGYSQIVEIPSALSGPALLEALKDAQAIGIRSSTQLNSEVLRQLPNLKAIGCFCIGTNQVDIDQAAVLGIPVFNAPYSNTRSVAELVIAQSILLLRRIPEKNFNAHRGQWDKNAVGAYEVRNKILGIIGYGNIGAQVGVLAESIGMRVCYYDIENKLPLGNAKAHTKLDSLLAEADVVTLHVPGGSATKQMIGVNQLLIMKATAVLINASRGHVIDIDALHSVLLNKKLSGAALDVFPIEPSGADERFNSPLQGFDNVILTPHIGGSTEEAQENIGREVAEKITRFLGSGVTQSAVNFPEIGFTSRKALSRILHVHKNETGVIAEMNSIFASYNLNIISQQLQTNSKLGYVITDIDSYISQDILDKLKKVSTTIRCDLIRDH
jgi:D-3-phosphoglycerate dehydrogenase